MGKRIYIIRGITGEYSYRQEWLVKAYTETDEVIAKQKVIDLNVLAREVCEEIEANDELGYFEYDFTSPIGKALENADPRVFITYPGISYYLESVALHET